MAREWLPGAIWNLPKCGWVIKWMWGKQQQCWKWGCSALMGTRVTSVCLQAVGGTLSDHRTPPLAAEKKPSALQFGPWYNRVLKSFLSTWFDMTSEVHMPHIPRFLCRMIWYLQLINFPFFKQNHVGSGQQFEMLCLDIVAYQTHMCVLRYYVLAKAQSTEPTA